MVAQGLPVALEYVEVTDVAEDDDHFPPLPGVTVKVVVGIFNNHK